MFGARGVGKSTFLRSSAFATSSYLIDLLDDDQFDLFLTHPKRIEEISQQGTYEWIIVDEVQRVPRILNSVHRLMESQKQKFVLSGSSSRKLKRKGANLLGGRAYVYSLHPFTYLETSSAFDLNHTLSWGSLPKICEISEVREKLTYLRSYTHTFLKAEIMAEQVVRNLEPFREFLQVAAQMSGKIINYSKIAKQIGVQIPTVQNYFSILEDTYLGYYLPHFDWSIRKSQIQAPKFYLFDNGIKRFLDLTTDIPVRPGNSEYGGLFEAFFIQEVYRLNHYFEKDFRLAYLHTKHDAEIDLILFRRDRVINIEIKSGSRINEIEVRKMAALSKDFGKRCQSFYVSQDPQELVLEKIHCLPWYIFLERFSSL